MGVDLTCKGRLPQLPVGPRTSGPGRHALWGSRGEGPGHTSALGGCAWWWHRCSLENQSLPAGDSVKVKGKGPSITNSIFFGNFHNDAK